MKVIATRLTDWELVADCARVTAWKGALGKEPSDAFKERILRAEHSPIRALIYKIEMRDIPSFVSVHLVRHNVGVTHFVSSNREDRNGGFTNIDRNSPVNHTMIINAQALVNMARKRLCNQASKQTREVMHAIKTAVGVIDPILEKFLVPMCAYLGHCNEMTPCAAANEIKIKK